MNTQDSHTRTAEALALHQAGRFDEAEAVYRQLVAENTAPPEALHAFGVLLCRREAYAEGLPLLRRALESNPQDSAYWLDYASSFLLAGQPDEARFIAAMARRHGMSGERFDTLEKRIAPFYEQHPDYVTLRHSLAAAEKNGDFSGIEAETRAALERFGPRPRLLQFLGTVLLRSQRNEEARTAFEQALKGEVPEPHNLNNQYGIVLNRLGYYAEAEQAYFRALELLPEASPEQVGVWVNLGDNFNDALRFAEALPWLEKAVHAAPKLVEAKVNLATCYKGLHREAEALALLEPLIIAGQATLSAQFVFASLLHGRGRLGEAADIVSTPQALQALRQRPDLAAAALDILLEAGLHAEAGEVIHHLAESADQPSVVSSTLFKFAYLGLPAAEERRLAERYGRLVAATPFTRWSGVTEQNRLRIGFVSGDFRAHPVGYFLHNVLRALQKSPLELVAFSNLAQSEEDTLTAELRPLFAAWHNIADLSDDAAAQYIHAQGVHILIDLSGHTDRNRLPVFARCPAPLQISWIGYYGTTGLPCMDAVLADETGVPKPGRTRFVEQVAYLPTRLCFTPPDMPDTLALTPLPAIQNGYVTFGCFQKLAKYSDSQLRLWGEILRTLPTARLRLQAKGLDNAPFRVRFLARLRELGIPVERVSLHGAQPREAYLRACTEVDVVLDTFPYPGGTTTCEALCMGVPVLTLSGETLLERQGASILKAVGLGKWITGTPQEYVKRAVALAGDVAGLQQLRNDLRSRVQHSTLCDGPAFAVQLERSLRKLWARIGLPRVRAHRAGQHLTRQGAESLLQQAIALYQTGDSPAARPLMERLVEAFPEQGVLWKVYGAVLTALGEHAVALTAKRRAVELSPHDPDALANLGNSLQEADELDEAESCLRTALELFPNHLNALNNLGMVLFRQFRHKEAQSVLEQALALEPNFSAGLLNYGNVLRDQNKVEEAEQAYKKSIELEPLSVIAHLNLGMLYSERKPKRPIEAEASFLRALELNADHVETLVKLGELYREGKRFKRAEDCFSRATQLNPQFAQAWVGLAGVKAFAAGNLDEAIPCLELALEKAPDMLFVRSSLLFNHGYTSKVTPEEHLRHARLFGEGLATKAEPFTDWNPPATPPLRVGLIGGDFRAHPVGYFLENILKYLDGNAVELYVYSNNPYDDAVSARLAELIPNWRNVHGVSVKKVVDYIREENLHILIDMAGHTGHNRMDVFPYRPAPVQATWLGYPSTTGVAAIDWLIADETGVPPQNREHFTEKIWYVPHTRLCFTPPQTDLEVSPLPALQHGYMSFGCVQNLTKITDDVLELWSRILSRLPDALLRVQAPQFSDMKARDDFRARLAEYGVDARRATLIKPTDRNEYLDLLRENDVLLDTFPYPGGTTTCEALWMGVPTLTLAGNTLLARQGASLLTAGGLADWVAYSKEDYVEQAVARAQNLSALADLREHLRAQVAVSPLFDGALFAHNLKEALQGMWLASQSGKK